jgi:hypothetical protein
MYSTGENEISKERLAWMYYEDYLSSSNDYIKIKINLAINNIDNRPQKVICLNTNEIYDSISSAEKHYNLKSLARCCKGNAKYCGKLYGIYLQWQYHDEYLIKPKKLLTNKEIDNWFSNSYNELKTKIICITTKEIFNCINDASKKYNIFSSNIIKCCKSKRKYVGLHPETGDKLIWMYMDDYKNANITTIENKLSINKKIICLNTLEVFNDTITASKIMKCANGITRCCKGIRKSCGKDLITGESLRWMYYEDYIAQQNKPLDNLNKVS